MADVETVKVEPTNGKKEETEKDVIKSEDNSSQDDDSQNDLTQLERDIIRQIEYYFSENNMRRDKFLIQKVAENESGWVDVDVLLTFNRLKTITEDAKAIIDAIDKSPHGVVQVSEDRKQLRRHPENPLPEFSEERRKEVQARTAYAKGFPLDSTLTQLIDFFNKFENVEQVMMRKYFCPKTKKHLFKGSVFITFSKQESAEDFANKESVKYGEKELLRYTQSKYHEAKKTEVNTRKKTKQVAADKEQYALPKSAVVHFTGAEGEMSREDIKAKIAELDDKLEIAFVHFQKGDKEGDLRFNKENLGKDFIAKLEDGKLAVNDCKLTFTLVEGEAEEKFLEKAIEDIKQRRSKMSKGKGGRGNFGRKRRNDGGKEHSGKRARSGRD